MVYALSMGLVLSQRVGDTKYQQRDGVSFYFAKDPSEVAQWDEPGAQENLYKVFS